MREVRIGKPSKPREWTKSDTQSPRRMQLAGASPHKNRMKRSNREIYNPADRCRGLDDANFAYMNRAKTPILCSRKKAWEWYHNGGGKRCNIRLDEGKDLAGWGVNTRFHFWSSEADGPPLFWEVSVWFSDGNPDHFRSRNTRFGTMAEALLFHERLLVSSINLKGLFEDEPQSQDEDRDPADWWKQ